MNLNKKKIDTSLFTKNKEGVVIVLFIYVDNILVTRNSLVEIKKCKEVLSWKLRTKYLGKIKYLLGIEVLKENCGLGLLRGSIVLSYYMSLGCWLVNLA